MSINAMRDVNWDRVEKEVVEKIRALREIVEGLESNALNDKIAHDLIVPPLELLGQFCALVEIEEEEEEQ